MEPSEVKKLWEEYVKKLYGVKINKDEPELEEMKKIMNIKDDFTLDITITPAEYIKIDFTLFDNGSCTFNGP